MAYALYGFLRDLGHRLVRVMNTWSKEGLVSSALGADVDFVVGELLGSGIYRRQVKFDDLEKDRERLLHGAASLYSQTELDDVFGAEPGTFKSAVFGVEIDRPNFPSTSFAYQLREDMELVISYQGDTLSFILNRAREKGGTESAVQPGELEVWLRRMYVHFLMLNDIDFAKQPHCITWARPSIAIFYQGIETSLRLSFRDLLQKESVELQDGSGWISGDPVRGSSRYPLPIEDEIDFLKDIPTPFTPQPSMGGSSPVSDIEKMTGGYYTKEDNDFFFRSIENNTRQFSMPLHLASSSATELSSLYFFFATGRHSSTSVLIIDEPESHLDTANQIHFAQALVRWVNAGVRVLISTHSDYIVKEINTLMMLNSEFEDKSEVMDRLEYTESLDPCRTKAYTAQNGGLDECKIDRYGINDPYFDVTIDRINVNSNEMTARLMAEEENE